MAQKRIKISELPITDGLKLSDIIPYNDNPSSNAITKRSTFETLANLFSEGYFARIVSSRSELANIEAKEGSAVLVTGAEDAGVFRAELSNDTVDNITIFNSATFGYLWKLSLVESKTSENNGGGFYTYEQGTPSNTWTIVHNLGRIPPSASVIDSVGNLVIGDILHVNNNKMIITFDSPFSGKVYIN
jgi:hypothetical protein